MTPRSAPGWLTGALEFGPLLAFVITYLVLRDATFDAFGQTYSGFIAVTALFLPIFVLSTAALWALTGRLTRMQIGAAGLLVLFGGLSVAMNAPGLLKIKPTLIYVVLAAVLAIGLWRNKLVIKWLMEDTFAMKKKGWRLLTRRLIILFAVAALANEAVWRTQSEATWLIFETLVMPALIGVFFLAQIPLFVTYAA